MTAKHRHPRYRIAAALVTAALAVTMTGCASQDGSGSQQSGSKQDLSLTIGQISNSVAFFPIYVAKKKGYFAQEGLKVNADIPLLGTGAKLAAALQSGSIDVGGGVMTDAFNLNKASGSAKIIASLVNSYYVDVIVGTGFDGPGTSAPVDERVKALKGKKIGITGPGSGTEALVNYLLAEAGMKPSDVTLVNLGGDSSGAVGALKTHRVDALAFFQPVGQQAQTTGAGTIYISPARGDISALVGDTHGIVFTTKKVLDAKPKAVDAFVKAIAKAEQAIHGSTATVKKLLSAYLQGMDQTTIDELVPIVQKEVPDSPALTESGYGKAVAFHKESGLFPSPPSFGQIVPKQLAG